MSSLVERLRVRSERRPLYTDDDSDDDLYVARGGSESKQEERPPERIVRDDAKNDTCKTCGKSGNLIACGTCTYVFHRNCLPPPLKVIPGDGRSCPHCVTPLTDVERILDCEMRPTVSEEVVASKPGLKQTYVKQYLVKWKGFSYLHCTWIPEKDFLKASKTHPRLKTRLNNFHKQMESMDNSEDDWVAIRPEWTTVDRILASRSNDDGRQYYVKWKELPYDECTWEAELDISAFQPQIERFEMIQSRGRKKSSTKNKNTSHDSKELKHRQKEFQQYEHSPEFISGGTLHPYQLEGLNFLRFSWSKNTHVILADEMGLGKTIQSIAFLASLSEEKLFPHLVVAPLSTLRNWEREFATWAPQLNIVMYFGSAQAREIIRQYEFYFPKEKTKKNKKKKNVQGSHQNKQARIKFDVLLTSYEMINMDSGILKPIQWECMIVDEGHRLKNKDSKLFLQLKLFSTKHRVLLTGTPLQNNLDELFMLMHFLDAGKFASIEDFQKEFKDINQEEQVARLHKMLAPHLLRRVKKDVMKELPPKKELILRVELSSKQKEYYKAILTRNYQILARRGGAQISLINVVMELRKLCCHAYMLEGVEPDKEPNDANEGLRQLLDASGKSQLLDKMMVKLKEQGHRVLIYSQFQHMLDLLEDYLSYKKWNYERIDGRISGAERQIRIDRFNAKNSTRFCFLLSTRAGGLGINLATADTVIIYDSDWNPHADLQAMARAHRLGQTNKVMIYRLITRGTIEERMMQLTKKKMILEHLVVGRLKAQTVNQEELDDIIRYGSKELFADESDEAGKARQIHYDDAAIDRLLNRDQIGGEESSIDEEEDDFLKAFKVANFEYIDEVEAAAAKEEEARKRSMTDRASSSNSERANYWDELLRDRYEVQQIEELTTMGKGKRSRKQMVAAEEDDFAGLQDVSSEDEDYCYEDDLSDVETNLPGNMPGRRGQLSKKKSRDYMEPLPLMEGEGRSFRVLGFNQNQRAAFVQTLMRFGFQDYNWKEFLPRLKGKSPQEIQDYAQLFMNHLLEGVTDSPTFSDGVPKEGLRVDDVMVRLGRIQNIEEKAKFMSKNPGASLFSEDILLLFPGLTGRNWKAEHDLLLLKSILKHGYARWQAIVEDKDVGLADVVRQELNLPVINGSFTEGVQMNEDANSGPASGASEVAKGSQSYPDYSSMYQFREVQRRMVEFIRKRYFLLEKALDLECAKSTIKPCEPENQESEVEPKVPEAQSLNPLDTNSLLKELPILEPIGPNASACDNKGDCREMPRLYNEICRVVEDNAVDSVQAYLDDRSAGSRLRKKLRPLEIICEDVQRILTGTCQSDAAAEGSNNVHAVGDDVLPGGSIGGDNNTGSAVESSQSVHASQPDVKVTDCASGKVNDVKTPEGTNQTTDKVIVLDE
ncbi:CHD3-type chromatin-remodeling factor PICKLE [Elaeis guineensis]|uniref:CHD3-type chromatin-remodeling factor PICKLE n=1 Tax=Elaeis guineensis var. tenera TaxID=51953 RepID=A0A6I9SFC2_ELAGV|nr:CHD3-type chromatin-remodeling factor PICKLE [Elaeis guineensis]